MLLNQADSQVFEAVFGKDALDKVSGALTSLEEMPLGLRITGKILTPEQITENKETAINQGKELRSKELAKALGLTLDAGEKEPEIIAEKLKSVLSATYEEKYKNQTPAEETIALAKKASQFEDSNKKLLETLGLAQKEVVEWQDKYTKKEQSEKEEKLNTEILSCFPDKMAYERADALLVTKHILKEEKDDNGVITYLVNGARQLDSLGNPESLKNVISFIVDMKKWNKAPGMGGGDRKPEGSGIKGLTPDAAKVMIQSKGINPTSQEGLKLFKEYTSKQPVAIKK